MITALTPGFASPAEAQTCFRAVLAAFARPGMMVEIASSLRPPPPLSLAAAAILLTLTDQSTAVALPDAPALGAWLGFHTGARFVAPEAADFIAAREPPALDGLQMGTDDEPEAGATLVLECPSLKAGCDYRLTGPGIYGALIVRLPIERPFARERAALYRLNPRGIDMLLCAGARMIGLPRSTRMEPA